MEIKKLENRYQWICNIDGFSYVRTEIEWKDKPNSIVWYLNQDESGDEEVTGPNDDELEELFWKELEENPFGSQQRSYSEEDMKKAWTHGETRSPKEFAHLNNFYEWFKQFKKK